MGSALETPEAEEKLGGGAQGPQHWLLSQGGQACGQEGGPRPDVQWLVLCFGFEMPSSRLRY